MSKSACGRGANIAKQTCAKKTNILVYEKEKIKNRCPSPSYAPPISHPTVKRIKICTGAELKKMCAPPPCPCPPKEPPMDFMKRLMNLLVFGAKSSIALGMVYVTYDLGFWGDLDRTRELYLFICEQILPNFVDPVEPAPRYIPKACEAESELLEMHRPDPYCCDKFPIDHETQMYEMQRKWNELVTKTFSGLANFPRKISSGLNSMICNMTGGIDCDVKEEPKPPARSLCAEAEEECDECDEDML